jgi:hypothetical protein
MFFREINTRDSIFGDRVVLRRYQIDRGRIRLRSGFRSNSARIPLHRFEQLRRENAIGLERDALSSAASLSSPLPGRAASVLLTRRLFSEACTRCELDANALRLSAGIRSRSASQSAGQHDSDFRPARRR